MASAIVASLSLGKRSSITVDSTRSLRNTSIQAAKSTRVLALHTPDRANIVTWCVRP
jgi:hypothetical protein